MWEELVSWFVGDFFPVGDLISDVWLLTSLPAQRPLGMDCSEETYRLMRGLLGIGTAIDAIPEMALLFAILAGVAVFLVLGPAYLSTGRNAEELQGIASGLWSHVRWGMHSTVRGITLSMMGFSTLFFSGTFAPTSIHNTSPVAWSLFVEKTGKSSRQVPETSLGGKANVNTSYARSSEKNCIMVWQCTLMYRTSEHAGKKIWTQFFSSGSEELFQAAPYCFTANCFVGPSASFHALKYSCRRSCRDVFGTSVRFPVAANLLLVKSAFFSRKFDRKNCRSRKKDAEQLFLR